VQRRHASVQTVLPLDDIAGDVLVLRGGDCRAVLEAGSVNFALKSEAEQEAILSNYRRFLNALSYPVQILVRVVPTDVEVYLAGLRAGQQARDGDVWRRLAQDHETFVRTIARERTLLDRRGYVIVPAGTGGAFDRTGIAWPRRRRARERSTLLAARRALAFRCAEIEQGLAAFGVPVRRLDGADLVALWRAALAGTPVTAGGAPPAATPVLMARAAGTEAGGA
jgi:hypothetical protein